MSKLTLTKKKQVINEEKTVNKDVEDILEDKEIKKFGRGGAYLNIPSKHIGKKAIIGIYEK